MEILEQFWAQAKAIEVDEIFAGRARDALRRIEKGKLAEDVGRPLEAMLRCDGALRAAPGLPRGRLDYPSMCMTMRWCARKFLGRQEAGS